MRFTTTLLLCSVLLLFSCKEEKAKVKQPVTKSAVAHYICKNNCATAKSDKAGICPTCNIEYTHNTAFHNEDFLKTGPLVKPDHEKATDKASPANRSNSPARNAKGVFHYTCTNGCAGGAGTAEKCNNCGETLAHNTAYHN